MTRPLRRMLPAQPGPGPNRLEAREYETLADVPQSVGGLFETAGTTSVCLTRDWFEMFTAHNMLPGERLRLLATQPEGSPDNVWAFLLGRHRDRDRLAYGGRTFTSLDDYYTLLYAPLLDPVREPVAALDPLIARLCSEAPPYDVVRFQPLDPRDPTFDALRTCLRHHGFAVQTYRQFGVWYEPIEGIGFDLYLAERPLILRNTIERKRRSLERRGSVEFRLGTGGHALETAIADYERVYAASWKAPEPNAVFIRDLVRRLAAADALRLSFLLLDGALIAAQIWIRWGDTATLYKLAHDQCLDQHSPGTLLTAWTIERLLEEDHVREINFGPGDDPYKRLWASQSREMWGILAFNPATLRGRLGTVRHIWGRGLKQGMGF